MKTPTREQLIKNGNHYTSLNESNDIYAYGNCCWGVVKDGFFEAWYIDELEGILYTYCRYKNKI